MFEEQYDLKQWNDKLEKSDKLILIGIIALFLASNSKNLTLEMLKNKLKNFGTIVTYFSISAEVSNFLDYLKYVDQEKYTEILFWLIYDLDK